MYLQRYKAYPDSTEKDRFALDSICPALNTLTSLWPHGWKVCNSKMELVILLDSSGIDLSRGQAPESHAVQRLGSVQF